MPPELKHAINKLQKIEKILKNNYQKIYNNHLNKHTLKSRLIQHMKMV